MPGVFLDGHQQLPADRVGDQDALPRRARGADTENAPRRFCFHHPVNLGRGDGSGGRALRAQSPLSGA